jgi:hypothetical protein
MNKFYLTFLLLCCAIVAIFSIGATNIKRGTDRSKEYIFTHKYHLKEAGAVCIDCHKDAPNSSVSSDNLLPKMAICYNCHDEKTTECTKCHKDTIDIKPFVNPTRDFRYSHKFHISLDSIDCRVCHPGMEEVNFAYENEKAIPEMNLCFGCHNNGMDISKLDYVKKINSKNFVASKNCELCHINLSNLKPETHYSSNFSKSHARMARVGLFDNECETCHADNFCQNCHAGSRLLPLKDFISNATSEKNPKPENLDNTNKMILQNVHSLNYIMTHGFDARTKKIECFTCHDQQNFCNECHSGNNNGIRRKPKWHTASGFTTIGRGTGGGLHAQYAKRDIETCMSCHDTQGGDPVCLMCHMDVDGVKGTDPKTHTQSYQRDVNGIWMTDANAVCFNCHVDIGARTRKAGQGFCGYCHGGKRN